MGLICLLLLDDLVAKPNDLVLYGLNVCEHEANNAVTGRQTGCAED